MSFGTVAEATASVAALLAIGGATLAVLRILFLPEEES